MKQILSKENFSGALNEFKGAYAQIWAFHISLKRIVIRLSFTKQDDVLYIWAGGCEYIQGAFSWKTADIAIEDIFNDTNYCARIFDENGAFELKVSGGVVLFYGRSDDTWLTIDELEIDNGSNR